MSSFFLGICCRFFWDFRFVLIPFALGLVPDTFFCTFFFYPTAVGCHFFLILGHLIVFLWLWIFFFATLLFFNVVMPEV